MEDLNKIVKNGWINKNNNTQYDFYDYIVHFDRLNGHKTIKEDRQFTAYLWSNPFN